MFAIRYLTRLQTSGSFGAKPTLPTSRQTGIPLAHPYVRKFTIEQSLCQNFDHLRDFSIERGEPLI